MNGYLQALKKYAVFRGRATRAEYWSFFIVNVVIAFALVLVDRLLGITDETGNIMLGLYGLYVIAMVIPGIAVGIRRMHDAGHSGWSLLALLIPAIGTIVVLFFLLQRSQEGSNAYGPGPGLGATPGPGDLDPLGAFAHVVYIVVGGLLVFGYAWSLQGAVQNQRESVCRALSPKDCSTAEDPEACEQARVEQAPAFTAKDLQGNEVTLDDFAGKLVVLNFWATWCEPCITEWPQVAQLADRLADRDDVVVVAMSIDDDPALIEPFLQRMALADSNVQVLWDPTQKLHTKLGSEKIPDTYFVGPDGEVVHTFVNVRKWGMPGAYKCVEQTATYTLD